MEKSDTCDVNAVTTLLRKRIPDIKVDSDIGSKLSYKLNSGNSASFKLMLRDLEDHSKQLGTSLYSISLKSLEEVFIKVTTDAPGNVTPQDSKQYQDLERTTEINIEKEKGTLRGLSLLKNQFHAMMMKRAIYTKRHWVFLLLQISIPVILVVSTISVKENFTFKDSLPPLEITLESYKTIKPVALLSSNVTSADTLGGRFVAQYENLFANPATPRTLLKVPDIREYIINLKSKELVDFNERFLIGVTVTDEHVTTWFNNQPYHTVPLSLDVTYNAMVKAYCPDCSISVTNEPLPFDIQARMKIRDTINDIGFLLSLIMGTVMCLVAGFYILFYVKERKTRAKLLQFVSGIGIGTFWSTAFLWDMMTYLITILLLMASVVIFHVDGFKTVDDMGRLFALLMGFAWSVLPLVYLFPMCFSRPSSGFTFVSLFGILMGPIFFSILIFNRSNSVEPQRYVVDTLLAAPQFALTHGLSNLYRMSTTISVSVRVTILKKSELNPLCFSILGLPEDV